jgi:hypothetical protein
MYSAPTDHESALDLWQCVCIIVKMAGCGGMKKINKKKEEGGRRGRSAGIYIEIFLGGFD